MALQQLEQALAATLSADRNEREPAERALGNLQDSSPDQYASSLVGLLRTSQHQHVRMSCAIMLRRSLCRGEPMLFDRLSAEVQAGVKRELLQAMYELPPLLKRQTADTVAELASGIGYRQYEAGGAEWPELFQFLFNPETVAAGAEPQMACAVFSVFLKIADASPDVLESTVAKCIDAYSAGLASPSREVRVAAALASITHAMSAGEMAEPMYVEAFQQFIPIWMQLFTTLLNMDHLSEAGLVLQALVDLAADTSALYAPHLETVSALMLQVGGEANMDDAVRRAALQWFVNVAVDDEVMARRSPSMVQNTVHTCLALMLSVEGDASWSSRHEPILERDVVEDEGLFGAGDDALVRVSLTYRRKRMLPVVMPLVGEWLGHADWKYRLAALTALGAVQDILRLENNEVPLQLVLERFQDPHPRVGYAAVHAVAMMALDHSPELQTAAHQEVVGALLQVLSSSSEVRLQSAAAQGLFNFFEEGDAEVASMYMRPLVQQLFQVIQRASHSVVAGCLTVVASLAGKEPHEFSALYTDVMPFVQDVIRRASGVADRPLRARAMEAATFIGMAVGPDLFAEDADSMMGMFMQIMSSDPALQNDASFAYMLHSWTRICTVLKDRFVPYLPGVMPHVFKWANIRIGLQAEAVRGGAEQHLILEAGRQDQNNLDDKISGLNMLAAFLGALAADGHFLPFLEDTSNVVLPLLDCNISEDVRCVASSMTPDLVVCAVDAMRANRLQPASALAVFQAVTGRLHACLAKERRVSVMITLVNSLRGCIDAAGEELAPQMLSDATLEGLVTALATILQNSVERIAKREAKAKASGAAAGGMDEEALDDLREYNETESRLSYCVSETVSSLIKNLRAKFLGQFARIYPLLQRLVNPACPVPAIVTAVFIFDDVLEHIGPAAQQYFEPLMEVLLGYVVDKRYQLRQAAAYGIGAAAASMGELFARHREVATKRLLEAAAVGGRDGPQASAADNCISALGKLIQHQGCVAAAGEFVNLLPLTVDFEEGAPVYSTLLTLVEQGSSEALGQGMSNLPRIVAVLTDAYETEFTQGDEHVDARISALFRKLRTELPAESMAQLEGAIGTHAEKFRTIGVTQQ